tara:strand:- start:49 stop:573 length:525 start_codon:yes stop_codon:yes gene_type:complete
MRKVFTGLALTALGLLSINSAKANDFSFSVGSGYPYFATLEGSMATSDKSQRWFANYKMALDDGFSAGFEQGYGDSLNHAFGGFVGAVGIYHGDDCKVRDDHNDIGEAIGNAIGCTLKIIFDDETLNGAGLSYSYYFKGINNPGWRLRFEAGYGKASHSKEERGAGGITISYQF